MKIRRHHPPIKITAYLILLLMIINPALALQYQHFNQAADFISQIPDYQAGTYHIHTSQKDDVIASLNKQGYEVIPASHADVQHFLAGKRFSNTQALQLAANSEIEKPPEDECLQAEQQKTRDCPAECTDADQDNDQNCPTECKGNPCTDTDALERAKDKGPVSKSRQSKPAPRGRASVYIDQGFRLPKISSGGNGKDAAAVMLIVIGVVVIAALFIYAGKWIADMLQNDEDYYAYWWDIGGQFVNLDTDPGEHGNFTGIKFSGGFVPNMHTHFGLTAEIGRMDLDLRYNRNSTPQRINLEGTYWLLGPIVRWLFGNRDSEQNLAHNSYVYLELLGGNSDRDGVDMMGVGRIGINTGLGEHMRLGFHYGAFYLGLDEDQGFANDGDNYWNMYGLEIGYQF